VVGHSTGGMLAARYALLYPNGVSHLVLVDPVGLEDWPAKGVPPISIDQWYSRELTNANGIRAYEKSTYYARRWHNRYQRWVDMLCSLNNGPRRLSPGNRHLSTTTGLRRRRFEAVRLSRTLQM
jgi:pimeloyl-ACP methyl ester carboxylesterase